MSGGKNDRSSKTAARPHDAWAAAPSTSTPRARIACICFAAESKKSKDIQQNS